MSNSRGSAAAQRTWVRIITLVVLTAATAASATAQTGEGYYICALDLCRRYVKGEVPTIRRGAVNHVRIIRNQIDLIQGSLQPNNDVIVNRVGHGTMDVGEIVQMGYADLDVFVPATLRPGQATTISFAGGPLLSHQDHQFVVSRLGRVTRVAQNPELAAWGVPVQVTLTGEDIGNTIVRARNHSVTVQTSSDSQLVFTMTATGPPLPNTVIEVVDRDSPGVFVGPGAHPIVVSYCTSSPTIGAPTLTQPQNGIASSFVSQGDKANVTFSWTAAPGETPNDRYVLHIETAAPAVNAPNMPGPRGQTSLPPLHLPTAAGDYVSDPGVRTRTIQLPRNQSYRWKVRAVNCGQPASFSEERTFRVQ